MTGWTKFWLICALIAYLSDAAGWMYVWLVLALVSLER